MKCVILAGGAGTRLSEETCDIPKPMVTIGDKPILWHIMKYYSCFGINEFIICCGYKGHIIKKYFADYYMHNGDITIHTKSGRHTELCQPVEDWKVTLVDTGVDSFTGKRLKKVKHLLYEDEPFCLTYGDGLANVDIDKLVEFHKSHDSFGTCTTVQKESRFGSVRVNEQNIIEEFDEKPLDNDSWINGGFFVFDYRMTEFLDNDMLERSTLPRLSKHFHLRAFRHEGFWKAMDTLRDKSTLEMMWENDPEWKIW